MNTHQKWSHIEPTYKVHSQVPSGQPLRRQAVLPAGPPARRLQEEAQGQGDGELLQLSPGGPCEKTRGTAQ